MTLLNDAARRISHTLRFAFYRATHRYNTIYIIYIITISLVDYNSSEPNTKTDGINLR